MIGDVFRYVKGDTSWLIQVRLLVTDNSVITTPHTPKPIPMCLLLRTARSTLSRRSELVTMSISVAMRPAIACYLDLEAAAYSSLVGPAQMTAFLFFLFLVLVCVW